MKKTTIKKTFLFEINMDLKNLVECFHDLADDINTAFHAKNWDSVDKAVSGLRRLAEEIEIVRRCQEIET